MGCAHNKPAFTQAAKREAMLGQVLRTSCGSRKQNRLKLGGVEIKLPTPTSSAPCCSPCALHQRCIAGLVNVVPDPGEAGGCNVCIVELPHGMEDYGDSAVVVLRKVSPAGGHVWAYTADCT